MLHEPHSGVANSRQVGLEAAKGMYILYVDADDQVDPCMIADMYQVAVDQEADMVLCGYRELTHEGRCIASKSRLRLMAWRCWKTSLMANSMGLCGIR